MVMCAIPGSGLRREPRASGTPGTPALPDPGAAPQSRDSANRRGLASAPPTAAPGRGFTGAANGSRRWAGRRGRVSGEPRALGSAAYSSVGSASKGGAVAVPSAAPCVLHVAGAQWRDTPVTSPGQRWRLASPPSSLAPPPAGSAAEGSR